MQTAQSKPSLISKVWFPSSCHRPTMHIPKIFDNSRFYFIVRKPFANLFLMKNKFALDSQRYDVCCCQSSGRILQVLSFEMCNQVRVIRPTSSGIVNKRKENAAWSLRLANSLIKIFENVRAILADRDLCGYGFEPTKFIDRAKLRKQNLILFALLYWLRLASWYVLHT